MRRILASTWELLAAVLASCLLFWLILSPGFCCNINDQKVGLVKSHLEILRKSAQTYRTQTGKFPTSLDDLEPDYLEATSEGCLGWPLPI